MSLRTDLLVAVLFLLVVVYGSVLAFGPVVAGELGVTNEVNVSAPLASHYTTQEATVILLEVGEENPLAVFCALSGCDAIFEGIDPEDGYVVRFQGRLLPSPIVADPTRSVPLATAFPSLSEEAL